MKILVTGGSGTMGKALKAVLPDALYLSHADLDVTNEVAVWEAVYTASPDVVVHAAAITDHQCPDVSRLIETNVIGTQYVANACKTHCKLVYLSTHYVYPGERGNYRETDLCKPIGTYAMTKYAGEKIVQGMCPNHLIIRGSWYDYETRLKYWEMNGAFDDAWCSRIPVPEAAEKIARLVTLGAWGVYNIGGPRRTFHNIAERELLRPVEAVPRITQRYTLDYEFPADSSVNTEKYDNLVAVQAA